MKMNCKSLKTSWVENYPLHWINLERQRIRRKKMEWAINKGGWTAERWNAIDTKIQSNTFVVIPKLWQTASKLPGIQRSDEAESTRKTSRAELACLSSWQSLIENLKIKNSPSGWFLIMEDDSGSSLACPEAWPFNLEDITQAAGSHALAIQLAPISSNVRLQLHHIWKGSKGCNLAVPKTEVRSHGNGAVLLNHRAIPFLERHLGKWIKYISTDLHILSHPRGVRPVADKWLYACLPASTSWVCTYPLFCLEAIDSDLHSEHVKNFHLPSRNTTLDLWREDEAVNLIESFSKWASL